MFRIVLVHPEIPPNTGNVIRLAANTGCELHLIEPLGFRMEDKLLRRAGLDYHETAHVRRHASWESFLDQAQPQPQPQPQSQPQSQPQPGRMFAFTTRGAQRFNEVAWQAGDWLIFGSETAGLPAEIRDRFDAQHRVRLPMREGQRSLNLSNAVSVAVFEAWRQLGYVGGL
jgi:tRNA (cytidine/uridine-2'-O-)-methyltransferase